MSVEQRSPGGFKTPPKKRAVRDRENAQRGGGEEPEFNSATTLAEERQKRKIRDRMKEEWEKILGCDADRRACENQRGPVEGQGEPGSNEAVLSQDQKATL